METIRRNMNINSGRIPIFLLLNHSVTEPPAEKQLAMPPASHKKGKSYFPLVPMLSFLVRDYTLEIFRPLFALSVRTILQIASHTSATLASFAAIAPRAFFKSEGYQPRPLHPSQPVERTLHSLFFYG
jgi:hypothetical protein